MLTVGSFGFILFAALLAGLWRVTPQPRRWQLMLAASLVFYLSLDWQGCLLLCLMTLLVWQAALHLRGSPRWFYVGLGGALAPLTLLKLRPAALLLGQAFSLRIWDVSVPQVLLCVVFSVHHPGAVQPLWRADAPTGRCRPTARPMAAGGTAVLLGLL